jgi:transcriptional regulator with XRE-family HTH domain
MAIVASGQRQKDIAAAIGTDEATLSRIVNGLHADERMREALAAELHTTPDVLWPEAQAA